MIETDTLPFLLPAAAPRTDGDRLDWIRLYRSPRVGAATFRRLLAEHGSAAAGLAALPAVAAEAGVEHYRPCPLSVAEMEWASGRRAGARLVCQGDADYPALLAETADAPPFLWLIGNAALLHRDAVALVGARNASALGLRTARHLAAELGSAGLSVVSGLARGIDAAVHEASAGTGTVAVVAGGVDIAYPPENAKLRDRIAAEGALLSEMPPGLDPQARHFPRRNRIISGLCRGLVVVEGAAKSGSLITARNALDQGREVMAVPGHPFDARAAGCNMLIRDGATLVRSAEDICAVLSVGAPARPVPGASPAHGAHQGSVPAVARARRPSEPRPTAPEPASPGGAALGHAILNLLGPSPVSEDILIRQLRASPQQLLAALSELDIQGAIERHPGGLVSRLVA